MTKNELKFLCESQIAQCETWDEWKKERPHGKFYEACKFILELLDENKLLVETLNDCSRKRGKWIEVDTNMHTCSNCSHCFTITPEDNQIWQFNYCPNCGSYMRAVEE